MKKLLLTSTALFLIAGCATTAGEQRVDYVCPLDTNFTVVYSADGEHAALQDQSGRISHLTIAPAASGAYYKNDDGVSIHTKDDYAIVEFVKDRPISCTVWTGSVEE